MRAHYLQHVPFEGLGSIEPWLKKYGYQITSSCFYEPYELPDTKAIDFLIVMGGPMSVNDEEKYPWLLEEKAFIKEVIECGKPVLGICLGAQLIACAMGGEVFSNPAKEIGWFPIRAIPPTNKNDIYHFPAEVIAFHWHGETFSLPPKARHIACSEACENQAFQLGNNVIGLQFHLETTVNSARAIIENCSNELVSGKFVQSEEEILSVPTDQYDQLNKQMESVLEYLHQS